MGGRKLIRRLALGVFALVVVGDAGLLAGIWITREPPPKPLDAQRIFTASRPAVMLVQANFVVAASIPEPVVPKAQQDLLVRQLINMLNTGRLSRDQAAIDAAAVNLVVANPDAYFQPGSRVSDDFSIVNSGSGFFVTQDGYLITAAHVVSPRKEDIRAEILQLENAPDSLAQAKKEIQRSAQRDVGVTLTDAQLNQLTSWFQRWADKYITIDSVHAYYYLGFGTVEAGQRLISTGTRASTAAVEPVAPGRDVAVLKADVTGVPSLALATEDPAPGTATYVVGYPRQGYLTEPPPSDATIPATLTSGVVRGQLPENGWTAFGTDATVTHGNSGGPVLDRKGHVVGIVSFAATDGKGNLLTDQGFFVPASVLGGVLNKAFIKAAPGTLTSLYYQALSKGDLRHYRDELPLLSAVQRGSAYQAYVKDDIIATEGAILSGQDRTPPKLSPYLPEAGAAAGIAFLFLVGALVWPRRRSHAASPDGSLAPVTEAPVAVAPVGVATVDTRAESRTPVATYLAEPGLIRQPLRVGEPPPMAADPASRNGEPGGP